jgi:glycosyltransferase involved in cell wall biosynthesis
MSEAPEPSLSVCIITYNHARFITDALEGTLAQRTTFPYEIVVGDDGSSDDTVAICRALAARSGTPIRLRTAASNQGMMQNLLATLAECRGRYIALCEGDDYWIDRQKLQLQHEFLETHPEHSACFHSALVEHVDGRQEIWRPRQAERDYGVEDLFEEWLMPTASVVFRPPADGRYPPYLASATHGDLGLFVFLADRGKLGHLARIMSVYRKHPAGMMNSFSGVEFHRRQTAFLLAMNDWFGQKYRGPIYRRIARLFRSSAVLLARAGGRRRALSEFGRSLPYLRSADWKAAADLLRLLVYLVVPAEHVRWWRSRLGRTQAGL